MLTPAYSFYLNKKITPHLVAIGKFDGINPCLTGVTSTDKVFIYNPHQRTKHSGGRFVDAAASNISQININQTVTSLSTGALKLESKEDILMVGTANSVLTYNVQDNCDLFYKEVVDGANCSLIGYLGDRKYPMAIIGGNCSLQGFDQTGKDCFWTVTGDNVTSMALSDFNQDGFTELIVGSEDFDIRVFKEDEIIGEMTETEAITGLTSIMSDYFGYALANGTVGVYKATERSWRIKSKNKAISVFNFDLDGDGVPELITGWSNGKVDVRNVQSGEVIFKDNLPHSIAGIVRADFKNEGKDQLILCSAEGEIRGFSPNTSDQSTHLLGSNFEQESIRDLSLKKQTLLMELHNYEENLRLGAGGAHQKLGQPSQENDQFGVIPAATQLKTHLELNAGSSKVAPHVEVVLQTTNDTIIKAVLIFAEGIFNGESHVVHPLNNQLSNKIYIPLFPPKDMSIDLHIKALIGYKGSSHFHVFEVNRPLPKFAMYTVCDEDNPNPEPDSFVTFTVLDRAQKVVLWINQNFLLPNELAASSNLHFKFMSMRTSQVSLIEMDSQGRVTIRTNNMELAGDIIQSLVQYLKIDELASVAHFPDDIQELMDLMNKVEGLQSARNMLITDMADDSDLVKSLIVQAEDARALEEIELMKGWYQDLMKVNKDMIKGYQIRANNYKELLASLKKVNQIIQRAANLRVGQFKAQTINGCRMALKESQFDELPRVIAGKDS